MAISVAVGHRATCGRSKSRGVSGSLPWCMAPLPRFHERQHKTACLVLFLSLLVWPISGAELRPCPTVSHIAESLRARLCIPEYITYEILRIQDSRSCLVLCHAKNPLYRYYYVYVVEKPNEMCPARD